MVQNDDLFGKPSRFYWDDAIHEDYGGGSMDHRFGDFLTHPLYVHVHPGMGTK